MARLNRTCYACQTKYSYCPSCSRADAAKPSWASEFCSESCKDIWVTLTKYNMSMLTKSEAKAIISELDLKPIDTYVDCVKLDYNKIMEPEKKLKRGKRAEMKIIDEVMDIKPEVVEHVIENLFESQIEQPIIVAEPVAIEPEHEVVVEKENE